jgi:hypothetical protein
MQSEKKWPQGLKPALIFSLRGPEGPLFHGGAHSHGALTAVLTFMGYCGAYIPEPPRGLEGKTWQPARWRLKT